MTKLWQSCDNVLTMLRPVLFSKREVWRRLDIGHVLFFVSVIKTQMKKQRTMFSHLDQKSLVNKGFIIWPKENFYWSSFWKEHLLCCNNVMTTLWQCCDPRYLASVKSEEGVVWAHLARSGSRSERRLCFILPTCGFSEARGFKIRPDLQPRFLRSLWQRP